jgi:hypothetical protein
MKRISPSIESRRRLSGSFPHAARAPILLGVPEVTMMRSVAVLVAICGVLFSPGESAAQAVGHAV